MKCPECQGRGTIADFRLPKPCTACGGTGQLAEKAAPGAVVYGPDEAIVTFTLDPASVRRVTWTPIPLLDCDA